MMSKYTTISNKIQDIDQSKLNSADKKYYIEVTSRITEKLISALE